MNDHTVTFPVGAEGVQRIRIDSPGKDAQSAPIPDPLAFLANAAKELGLDVDDTIAGELIITTTT